MMISNLTLANVITLAILTGSIGAAQSHPQIDAIVPCDKQESDCTEEGVRLFDGTITFGSGNLDMSGFAVLNMDYPIDPDDAATKQYVLDQVGSFSETDPTIGTLTDGKWCTSNGTQVLCTSDQPVLAETDPGIATLTANKWCTSDGAGVLINCTTNPPVLTETDPSITEPSILDGVSWDELSSIPAGFADDVDNEGVTSVASGTGLTGGTITSTGTLSIQVPLLLTGTGALTGLVKANNDAADGYGLEGIGMAAGGHFEDRNNSGYADLGIGDVGIKAYGNIVGGHFKDLNSSGYANIATGNIGISAHGNTAGGYFTDIDHSGAGYIGYGDTGVRARGDSYGGWFETDGDTGRAVGAIGHGDSGYAFKGIADATGGVTNYGGHFAALGNSGFGVKGEAVNGTAGIGISGTGSWKGGNFSTSNGTGYADLGTSDNGVSAGGNNIGGIFKDLDSSTYGWVGAGTYSFYGTGSKAFVQNHPENPEQVIVYNAPEGDEVATYTRGSAQLVNGEARIPLGETFKWVTNPDIGLTAHLTPQGGWAPLYVAEKTAAEILVKSAPGFPDNVAFDYIVYGLRIGFEEISIVQEKTIEAYIPSMEDHRERYAKQPELREYNALERFGRMRMAMGKEVLPDMSAGQDLRDAVIEFDPAVHKLPGKHR